MLLSLFIFLQSEIPKTKKTLPGEKFGFYSLQDFLAANWFYLVFIVILVLIFVGYGRIQKRQRAKFLEEEQKKEDNSATNQ